MSSTDTSADDEEVFYLLGDERAIGDGVVFARLEVVVTCASAFGIVNVDIVVSCRNGIVEDGAVFQFHFAQHMLADYHTGLTHADFQCGGEKIGVFHSAVGERFEKIDHLDHLLTGNQLCLCHIEGVGRIEFDHTGGVEVKDIGVIGREGEDILSGIFDFSARLSFLIFDIDIGAFFLVEFFHIHTAHTEAEGHRLTQVVAFTTKHSFTACQRGEGSVTCRIDKVVTFKCESSCYGREGCSRDTVALAGHTTEIGVEEKFNARLDTHTVEYNFHCLFVEMVVTRFGCDHGTTVKCFHLSKNFLENSTGELTDLVTDFRRIRHKRHNEHCCCRTTEGIGLFAKKNFQSATGCGNGSCYTGKSSAGNDEIVFFHSPPLYCKSVFLYFIIR